MQRLWRTKIGATSLNQLVTPALLLILTVLAPSPVQNDDAAVILLLQRTAKHREQPERIHTAWVFPPRQTNKQTTVKRQSVSPKPATQRSVPSEAFS